MEGEKSVNSNQLFSTNMYFRITPMNTNKVTFCLLMVFWIAGFPSIVCSQNITEDVMNELTVDRPGIAETPFTVAPRNIQLETGFEYYKRGENQLFLMPVTLFRTGLSKSAELRVSVKNITERLDGKESKGVSPVTIGIKTHIIEQRGWIPETDILADVVIPIGNSSFQPESTGHNILLLFQNDLSDKLAMNYNVGFLWDGFYRDEMFTASMCFNYLPSTKIGLFIEYFDFIRKANFEEHGVDAGLTWLVLPHLQIDLSAGLSFVDKSRNYFLASGFSIRLP